MKKDFVSWPKAFSGVYAWELGGQRRWRWSKLGGRVST